MVSRIFLILSVVIWFSASGVFAAEEKDKKKKETIKLGEVVVTDGREGTGERPNERLPLDIPTATGSRLNITPRETPATIQVIDRETLETRGVRDTTEAVRGAAGITAAAPPGSAGAITYRGFGTTQITRLFNGISVAYDAIAARPIDSWHVDRVEILGGPASFLYGQGAVGGVVNYVTRTATRTSEEYDALASYGRYNSYRAAAGANHKVGGEDAWNWFRVDASFSGSDGYVDRTDHDSRIVSASLLSDLTDRLSHTLAIEAQQEDRSPYWGTPVLNPVTNGRIDPRTRFVNYNASDGLFDQLVVWTRSILEYRLSEEGKITNTIYYYDADRQYRNVESYRWNSANTMIDRRSSYATNHYQRLLGDRLEYSDTLQLFGRSSQWAIGVDASNNEQRRDPSRESSSALVSTVDPYNPVVDTYSSFSQATGTSPARKNRLDTVALFIENRTEIIPQWSLMLGGRYESIALTSKNLRTPTAAEPARFDRYYSPLTGRLGLMYDYSDTLGFYVQYSTAADPPAGILTTTDLTSIQNFDLTTGRQIEVGSKFDFLDGLGNGTISFYDIERSNLVTKDPDNPARSIPVGRQSSRGVEGTVGLRLSEHWSFQGNLALLEAQYDKFEETVGSTVVSRAGKVPNNIPRRVANAWLTWRPIDAVESGVGARFVGSVYADTANTIKASDYDVWDAYAAYNLGKTLSLTARVRNLADETYAVWTTGTPMFIMGEPRAYELTLRMKF